MVIRTLGSRSQIGVTLAVIGTGGPVKRTVERPSTNEGFLSLSRPQGIFSPPLVRLADCKVCILPSPRAIGLPQGIFSPPLVRWADCKVYSPIPSCDGLTARPGSALAPDALEAAAAVVGRSLQSSCRLLAALGPADPALGARVHASLLVVGARQEEEDEEEEEGGRGLAPSSPPARPPKPTRATTPAAPNLFGGQVPEGREERAGPDRSSSGGSTLVQRGEERAARRRRNSAMAAVAGGAGLLPGDPGRSEAARSGTPDRAAASVEAARAETEARQAQVKRKLAEAEERRAAARLVEDNKYNPREVARGGERLVELAEDADEGWAEEGGEEGLEEEEAGMWEVGIAIDPWTAWDKADPERKQGEGFNLWPFGRKEEPEV
eukprot:1196130-Prorocentrum_minimum.AAC.3